MIQTLSAEMAEALESRIIGTLRKFIENSLSVRHRFRKPKIGLLPKKTTITTKKMLLKKKDTLNLYKINNYYYFRKRINKKLYRLSLKTTNFKKFLQSIRKYF